MAKVKGVKEFKARETLIDVKLLVGDYDSIITMRIDLVDHPQLEKNINALAAMIVEVAQKILEE